MNGQWNERCYPTFLVEDYRLERIRTHDPIATDLNGHAGTRTPKQGAKVVVDLATLPDSGPGILQRKWTIAVVAIILDCSFQNAYLNPHGEDQGIRQG